MAPLYANISAGYVGLEAAHLTLNARFFAWFWAEGVHSLGQRGLLFPQRVPRDGFFEELLTVEVPESWAAIQAKKNILLDRLAEHPDAGNLTIDLMNALARLGELEVVATTPVPDRLDCAEDARLQGLLATYRISFAVSRGETPDLEPLATLCRQLDGRSEFPPLIRAAFGNRLLVSCVRYAPNSKVLFEAAARVPSLIRTLETESPVSLGDRLSHSTIWRGLAMSPDMDATFQRRCLDRAWETLDKPIISRIEQTLIDELRCTLLQTEAKWLFKHRSVEDGIAALRRMELLDPHDSTAPSEIGLALVRCGQFEEALVSFTRAIALGPPALAMNWFLRGQCEVALNRRVEACASFATCAEIDHLAVSPWLELWRIYEFDGAHEEAARCSRHILEDDTLRSQLNEEELLEISIA